MNLHDATTIRKQLEDYQESVYLNLMVKANNESKEIMKDDLGSQFIENCKRDIAGEIVRLYFDTSDYYITVDQLARRIMEFDYSHDYDPLEDSTEQSRKAIYNSHDYASSTMTHILDDIDDLQS